jgi:hypothetical protein
MIANVCQWIATRRKVKDKSKRRRRGRQKRRKWKRRRSRRTMRKSLKTGLASLKKKQRICHKRSLHRTSLSSRNRVLMVDLVTL